jgi:N-dimethylarginine dimethylaminohydrolase
MKLNSHNEWDPLREVIVGCAEGQACLAFSTAQPVSAEKREKIDKLAAEAYPKWLIDEVNEDLQELCNVLQKSGVKVLRPNSSDVGKSYATPDWNASGERQYNMRDLHLVVGDIVIESPSQERHRFFEATGLYDIWYEYFKEGCRWMAAPKPRLTGDYMITYHEDGQRHQKLAEQEILFEAANAVRMGKDILYLVSRSGNYLGAKWIQGVLGDDYRVHMTEEIYRSSHIDSTVMCLKPGLVLLNASRVNDRNCPKVFDKWDKIYFSDIIPTPPETLEFHETTRKRIHSELMQMGIETDIDHMASDWIGMNFLSLDLQTVIVDKRQTALIKTLESYKLTPVPISFRHSHLLKGGIHCSTLDTVRESKLESYFD